MKPKEKLSRKNLFWSICITALFFKTAIMAEVRDAPNLVDYENMTATDLELAMRDSIICNEMMETDSVMCNGMVESGDGTYYELFMALDCANLGDLINYTLQDKFAHIQYSYSSATGSPQVKY